MKRFRAALSAAWLPRLGPEPARIMTTIMTEAVYAGVLLLGAAIFVAGGGAVGLPAVWIPGLVMLGLSAAILCRGFLLLHTFNRLAAGVLGVKVRFPGPPNGPADWERWCHARHVEPYRFADGPDLPESRR
jgi:hypothetical protein